MDTSKLDKKVIKTLITHGWEKGRRFPADDWIKSLVSEGYVINDPAKNILYELGNLNLKYHENNFKESGHYELEIIFNPVLYAEIDRLNDCCAFGKEMMFPIGGMYDYTLYTGESGKIYAADWKSIAETGNSIEDFLNNMFDPYYQIKEVDFDTVWDEWRFGAEIVNTSHVSFKLSVEEIGKWIRLEY